MQASSSWLRGSLGFAGVFLEAQVEADKFSKVATELGVPQDLGTHAETL